MLWCLGRAEPAVEELQLALRLAEPDPTGDGAGVRGGGAFGDPGVRVRMFLCHALACSGRAAEAVAVADQMVEQARQSGPADESDALATRGMMHAVFREPEPARAAAAQAGLAALAATGSCLWADRLEALAADSAAVPGARVSSAPVS